MKHSEKKAGLLNLALCSVAGFLAIMLGILIGQDNFLFIGLIQIIMAVVVYISIVFFAAGRNWLDIRAVFSAAWIGTIGLAALRLTEYQEIWQPLTWILLAGAYALFQIGATLGISVSKRYYTRVRDSESRVIPGRFSLHPGRLYYICVITTVIGLLCLAANVAIRGYIPFLTSDGNSYAQFYTKFYLFAVAASMISGLCYYCIVTQKCSVGRKVILVLCILYSTIIFPLLVVSRGAFVTSALSLATVVFYLHRKKLVPLILCAVMILGTYMYASTLRGYTAEQLKVFFEPATIVVGKEEAVVDTTEPVAPPSDVSNEVDTPTEFTLPPSLAFLYSYLTIGHDNFNEAVQNSQYCTYGARQMKPFNVILRIQALNDYLEGKEYYKVREHLTVTNILGDAYYDFHSAGILMMLLWAFVFGIIQGCAEKSGGPFGLLALGNTMTPVVLGTFATWMSEFSHWMHWGFVLILCIIACVDKKKETAGK